MANGEHSNGNDAQHGGADLAPDKVVLTYDCTTDKLEIGGQAFSITRMLDMLRRATMVLEQEWRLQNLQEPQQNAIESARVQAMLRNARARG